MIRALTIAFLLFNASANAAGSMKFYFGPEYASYLLFQDSLEATGQWQLGGEVGVENLIPNIGIGLAGSWLRYDAPSGQTSDEFEYIPISISTEFNMLPFFANKCAALYLKTGFGLYLWKGIDDDGEVIELPTGEKMEEKDFGFVGGLSLRLKLTRNLGVEAVSRYHYVASANLDKYGYFDKDDKIWENGFSLKFLFP